MFRANYNYGRIYKFRRNRYKMKTMLNAARVMAAIGVYNPAVWFCKYRVNRGMLPAYRKY